MNRKLIITKLKEAIVTAVLEDDKIVELQCSNKEQKQEIQLGDIYIGRVKNIVANINAAFIEVRSGVECYYAINENPESFFTKKIGKKPLCIGDELVVQVSKEAVKTKVPTVTSKLNFTGKYAVLTYGDNRAGVSNKIDRNKKERFQELAKSFTTEEVGVIIRTNAKDADETLIQEELCRLTEEYKTLMSQATTRTCFTKLKGAPKEYLTELRNIYQEGLTDIVIEDKVIYQEVKEFLTREQPEDLDKLRLYDDKLLPLYKLYSVETNMANALKEYVWLKSGAYIVIQPTEALTVIDVNTGKCISKKRDDEAYLKINMEAAIEVAKQIRLRNLSGIILIDFINMENKESMDRLLEHFDNILKKDPIKTTLVDVTKLQLVEITRKKVRRPLHEVMS